MLPVNDRPCLFLSRMLGRVLGKDIPGIANRRLAASRESARIGHVAISRRLNDLNVWLVYVVSVMTTIGIEVKVSEAVDERRHTRKGLPLMLRRWWWCRWHVVLHVVFSDCLKIERQSWIRRQGVRKLTRRKLLFVEEQ